MNSDCGCGEFSHLSDSRHVICTQVCATQLPTMQAPEKRQGLGPQHSCCLKKAEGCGGETPSAALPFLLGLFLKTLQNNYAHMHPLTSKL